MWPSTITFLLLLLSLLHPFATSICLPRNSPIPPPSPNPLPSIPNSSLLLIKSLCNHTDFSDLCLKSLNHSSPAALKSPTNTTILSALINSVDAKIHDALSFAQTLSADPNFDPKTRQLLRDCIDTYDDALDNLEAANEAIRVGDIGTRDSMLSAMISNFGTCEDGFQEFGIKSPLEDWSQTLQSMTDNCLAIININRNQDDY